MQPWGRVFERQPADGDLARWAASGAMALTGWRDGPPLAPPASLVPAVLAMGEALAVATAELGRAVELDALALLGERAAIAGLARDGRRSCGGATALWPAADGWIALALPRPDDVDLLPAWLGGSDVGPLVAGRASGDLVATGAELGLAVAAVGEQHPCHRPAALVGTAARRRRPGRLEDVLVVDLSALWAGPLAGHVLTRAGARVVKVESTGRPDGARRGPAPFFDLLHAGQESVALDLTDARDVLRLRRLLARADVVIEASRPRALAQVGVEAAAMAAGGVVWLSITGHGRQAAGAARIAFGDDAAVAGGLVAGRRDDPVFCADAIGDPVAGLLGALIVLECLAEGRAAVVDLAMAAVAAWCARLPPVAAGWAGAVDPPCARMPQGRARELGADTEAVLAELARP